MYPKCRCWAYPPALATHIITLERNATDPEGRLREIAARVVLAAVLWLCGPAGAAYAQADSARGRDSVRVHVLDSVAVVGRFDDLIGVAASASEGRVGYVDLRARVIARDGEMLESVPGLIVTQHSGEGKANQYFLRGFNLDHGTDFQTRVDGMPVNLVSNAHGQGYTDLNFLIPELVDHLDYRLGVYYATVGDFGSAGAAEFHLFKKLNRPFGTVTIGQYDLVRLSAGGSVRLGKGDLLAAGELRRYNGPWDVAQALRNYSGALRYSWSAGASDFSILGLAYHNTWNASDQIPLRAVEDGSITRWGQIDSTDGGNTQRYSLSGTWAHQGKSSTQNVQLFAVYSDLSLFSDFTYFLDDPVLGDQFNQREHRVILGANASQGQLVHAFGVSHALKFGLQSRVDIISGLGLYNTQKRERIGTVRLDDVTETGSGIYGELGSQWTSKFRTVAGLRGDLYTFDVSSDIPANSGNRVAGIVSPKLSLVYTPNPRLELYLSGGLGFHSNDARGTTITVDPVTREPAQQVDPLVRSRGAEIGVRATPTTGFRATAALWALHLDSELLFVGDAGITEPSSPSQRYGVTFANFYRPNPHFAFDLDVSFAHANFEDVPPGQDRIPGALENVIAAGAAYLAVKQGPFGAIRLRHFGSYPLVEDNSVRATPTTLFSLEAGYLLPSGIQFRVDVLNLFDVEDSDIQYYYPSRLPGEPADGVDDIHFHPVEPRQLRVSLIYGL